jgi:hypothetical protein
MHGIIVLLVRGVGQFLFNLKQQQQQHYRRHQHQEQQWQQQDTTASAKKRSGSRHQSVRPEQKRF